TGLYHHRARDYDPGNGRFTSVDPAPGNLRIPASLHRFGYANADPVNLADPTGRTTLISIQVTLSIDANIRSIYTKNLLTFGVKAVQASLCSVKPAFTLQALGLEMIARGAPGGDVVYSHGREMIVSGLKEI